MERGRLQRTSGKWGRGGGGGGGGFEISDITGRGGRRGVVCESSGRPKISEKIEIPKFLRAL